MKFKEILNRVAGLSFPIFGVSWNPPELDVTKARRVITFLEDRRVLFYPHHFESLDYAIQSVLEIRHFLTAELSDLFSDTELAKSLRAMRAACRKFLDATEDRGHGRFRFSSPIDLYTALGELRGVFGIHLGLIAAQYGLDIEDELAVILPAKEEPNKSLKAATSPQGDSARESSQLNISEDKKKRAKSVSKKKGGKKN